MGGLFVGEGARGLEPGFVAGLLCDSDLLRLCGDAPRQGPCHGFRRPSSQVGNPTRVCLVLACGGSTPNGWIHLSKALAGLRLSQMLARGLLHSVAANSHRHHPPPNLSFRLSCSGNAPTVSELEDDEVVKDTMVLASTLGRCAPGDGLGLLCRLLGERVDALGALAAGQDVASNEGGCGVK